jgi:hypothetical protein
MTFCHVMDVINKYTVLRAMAIDIDGHTSGSHRGDYIAEYMYVILQSGLYENEILGYGHESV